MPMSDALRAVDDLAQSPAFEATFENTRSPFSCRDITVPVTVAFGDRDWIVTPQSRRRNQLPAHAAWIGKPGWGHVPMWVDPAGVAALILGATA
jgi:pimeloyl-ACP methyl ester carboxylesterase